MSQIGVPSKHAQEHASICQFWICNIVLATSAFPIFPLTNYNIQEIVTAYASDPMWITECEHSSCMWRVHTRINRTLFLLSHSYVYTKVCTGSMMNYCWEQVTCACLPGLLCRSPRQASIMLQRDGNMECVQRSSVPCNGSSCCLCGCFEGSRLYWAYGNPPCIGALPVLSQDPPICVLYMCKDSVFTFMNKVFMNCILNQSSCLQAQIRQKILCWQGLFN